MAKSRAPVIAFSKPSLARLYTYKTPQINNANSTSNIANIIGLIMLPTTPAIINTNPDIPINIAISNAVSFTSLI